MPEQPGPAAPRVPIDSFGTSGDGSRMPYVRVFLMLAVTAAGSRSHGRTQPDPPSASLTSRSPAHPTAMPIKHLIVIFQENRSFDSYFGTYPVAANPPGQPAFRARRRTPSVNGLTDTLLRFNPNSSNPF